MEIAAALQAGVIIVITEATPPCFISVTIITNNSYHIGYPTRFIRMWLLSGGLHTGHV